MAQISEHINSSNQKINYYYQMIKNIFNLGSKKFENNINSTFQLSHLQNSLLVSIVGTPEKYLSNVDRKSYMIKVRKSSLNSSSTLFSCPISSIYSRVNCAQKQRLMLKLYIPGINRSIFQINITKISFLKTSQLITCLYGKSPSCNTFPQCIILIIFQN